MGQRKRVEMEQVGRPDIREVGEEGGDGPKRRGRKPDNGAYQVRFEVRGEELFFPANGTGKVTGVFK